MGLQNIFWSWLLLGHCYGFPTAEADSTVLQFHRHRKLLNPSVVVLHYRDGEVIRRRYSKKVFDNLSIQDFLYDIGETSIEVSTAGNVCPLKKENKIKNLSIELNEEGAYVLYELNPQRKPYRRFCSCTGDLGGKDEPLEKICLEDDRQYVLSQTLFE